LFRWELEDLAREQLTGMPPQVRLALSDLMDAVVIVDPAEYQRRPGEPARPLRTLPFGQAWPAIWRPSNRSSKQARSRRAAPATPARCA
jgi:hypothetical protein